MYFVVEGVNKLTRGTNQSTWICSNILATRGDTIEMFSAIRFKFLMNE